MKAINEGPVRPAPLFRHEYPGAIRLGFNSRLRYRAAGANQGSTPIRLTAAPVWQVSEHWKLALDVGAQWEKAEGQTLRTRYAEPGAIGSPGEDVDLALGLIRTSNNQNPRTSTVAATAGLTRRFK